MNNLIKVTKEEFYKVIFDNELDVIPNPKGVYPYSVDWSFRNGKYFGKKEKDGIFYINKDWK